MRSLTTDAKYSRKRRREFRFKNFCVSCFQNRRAKGRKSCLVCLISERKRMRVRCLEIKKSVLSHYGKRRKLLCCAQGCRVSNIYMLTLDHIADDGKNEVDKSGVRGGWILYRKLRTRGYPAGYQTLCANHQLLKEAMRRKRNWL